MRDLTSQSSIKNASDAAADAERESGAGFVRPALRGLAPYSPPRHDSRIDLFLDANECPPPPVLPESVLPRREALTRRYPSAAALEALLAERHGVEAARVIVTAGGDEAIDRVCRACLNAQGGDELILPSPSFEMIARYARLANANVVTPRWFGGEFPLDEVFGACSPRTTMIAVVSPNNPTGGVITRAQLLRLSGERPGVLLMVDLAYTEFADEDLTSAAAALPNAVLIRTFSKAWGCAGLRVGYAIGPRGVIDAMRAVASPFPVSGSSLSMVESLVRDGDGWIADRVRRVRQERAELTTLLRSVNIESLDSQGNFVLCRTAAAEEIRLSLAAQGIAVRGYSPQGALASCLRITCPASEADQKRLVAALKRAVAECAVPRAKSAGSILGEGGR